MKWKTLQGQERDRYATHYLPSQAKKDSTIFPRRKTTEMVLIIDSVLTCVSIKEQGIKLLSSLRNTPRKAQKCWKKSPNLL